MKSTEMLGLLQEFHGDKLQMRQAHVAAARVVTDYNFNNTYQYIINREDMHLRWLSDAIADLSGHVDEPGASPESPKAKGKEAQRTVLDDDSAAAQRFIDKWRPRIDGLPNARHRTLLNVVLGETLEHKRFFDLALAGRDDLLGRRADGAGTGNGVMSDRWVGDITK